MNLILYLTLAFIAVGTSIISAVVGMAGGIVLLAILTLVLPWGVVIPIHGIVQLVSNFSRAFILRKHIHLPIFLYFLLGAPFGAMFSTQLIQKISSPLIPSILIICLIIYTVFKPKRLPAIQLQYWQYSILGFVTGFLGLLIGATGPFLAVFFFREDLKKEEIVATTASVQILTHSLKIPAFLYLGFNYLEHLPLISIMIVGAIIGTELGIKILNRMNPALFTRFYKTVLLLIAIHLLFKNVLNII